MTTVTTKKEALSQLEAIIESYRDWDGLDQALEIAGFDPGSNTAGELLEIAERISNLPHLWKHYGPPAGEENAPVKSKSQLEVEKIQQQIYDTMACIWHEYSPDFESHRTQMEDEDLVNMTVEKLGSTEIFEYFSRDQLLDLAEELIHDGDESSPS